MRRRKLAKGANAAYWIAKIERNRKRDRSVTRALEQDGWLVLRYWESDVRSDVSIVARTLIKRVRKRQVA
jgi:DNA mismatch endonuclease (patch repair protein)